MNNTLRELYHTEKLKLNGGEIIQTKKGEYYLFCGYGKGDILKRRNTEQNYAYKSEIVILSRYMPALCDYAMSDLLGGSSTFLSLNKDMLPDNSSRYKNLKLDGIGYKIIGSLSSDVFNKWQMIMKMAKPDFHIRSFVTKEEAIKLIMSNPLYKVDKELDKEYLCDFNKNILREYSNAGADDRLMGALREKLVLVEAQKLENNPFFCNLQIRGKNNLTFYKSSKYCIATRSFGTCKLAETDKFMELYLARFKAKYLK